MEQRLTKACLLVPFVISFCLMERCFLILTTALRIFECFIVESKLSVIFLWPDLLKYMLNYLNYVCIEWRKIDFVGFKWCLWPWIFQWILLRISKSGSVSESTGHKDSWFSNSKKKKWLRYYRSKTSLNFGRTKFFTSLTVV